MTSKKPKKCFETRNNARLVTSGCAQVTQWYNHGMHIDLFTIFPEICEPYLNKSILGRAQDAGALTVDVHNIRDYAISKHRSTDDLPYGGGGGMVMKPEPVFNAVETVLAEHIKNCPVILLTPQGRPFTQTVAREFAEHQRIALVAGRYEGVDERVRQHLVTDEISLGDFVVTGGELPALAVIDATTRLLPGALGDPRAASNDSHGAAGLLEAPHYTRPSDYRGWQVPPVLLSGDHSRVERWRRDQAIRRTWNRRPDLLPNAILSENERNLLEGMVDENTSNKQDDG